MANLIKTQNLVRKYLELDWEDQKGLKEKIEWRSDEFDPADNPGDTITLRRPTQLKSTATAYGQDYSLPGVTQPPVGYQSMADVTVPLKITQRLETNLQYSIEDLSTRFTPEQIRERYLNSALTEMHAKLDNFLASTMSLSSGQVIANVSASTGFSNLGTAVTASTGNGLLAGLAAGQGLLNARGASPSGKGRYAVMNESAQGVLNLAQLTNFNPQKTVSDIYNSGEMGDFAGFSVSRSPLLPTTGAVATYGSPTVNGANQGLHSTVGGINPGTGVWAQTWSLVTSGWTANVAIPAGLKIAISGVNWAQTHLKTDTGVTASFVVVSATTATAGGAATLVLAEPLIYTGGSITDSYQNVTAAPANGATITVLNPSVLRPSFAFHKSAVLAASPEIRLTAEMKRRGSYTMDFGGFNLAYISDVWPGTNQTIGKLVCFVGATVLMPEWVTEIY